MITCSALPGRVVCGVVWNMDREKNTRYLEKVLSGIPDGFTGKLLEVPVGTGVLTMPIYQSLSQADIACLDYSPDMMTAAQRRARTAGLSNVQFQQGDVGALPFENDSFNLVLSLNGFHAFPDKEAAYREVYRVLCPGGTFCGCFYVKEENHRADWFVENLYTPKGFFTPPYETAESLRRRLAQQYQQAARCLRNQSGCIRSQNRANKRKSYFCRCGR